MERKKDINVCVVGSGLSARTFMIPFIVSTPGLCLHTIVSRRKTQPKPPDLTPAEVKKIGQEEALFPVVKKTHSTIDAALDDKEVNLVVLSTPNDTHYHLAKRALEAGKDVLVEKPFTANVAEADELISLARRKKCLLTVYHNRRWDGDFMTLKRMLDGNRFGCLVSIESHFDRYSPPDSPVKAWKMGTERHSGVLYDLGSHLVDQMLVLFGLPERVSASLRCESLIAMQSDGESKDDAFDVMMYYSHVHRIPIAPRGLVIKLSASSTSLAEVQLRYVVRGSEAGYIKHGLDPQENQIKKLKMKVTDETFGVEEVYDFGVLTNRETENEAVVTENGQYAMFFRILAKALKSRNEWELPVLPQHARDVIRVLEACVKSHEMMGQQVDVRHS